MCGVMVKSVCLRVGQVTNEDAFKGTLIDFGIVFENEGECMGSNFMEMRKVQLSTMPYFIWCLPKCTSRHMS